MSNGNDRRSRKRHKSQKRYKIRYDRVIAAALVLIVMIVVLVSCAKSCSKGKKKDPDSAASTSGNTAQSIEDNLRSSGNTDSVISSVGGNGVGDIQFTNESLEYNSVFRGDLVLVNSSNEYKFIPDDADPIAISGNSNSNHYIAKDLVTKLDSKVLEKLNSLMEGFYNATSNNDIVIIGGYRTFEEQNDKYNSGTSGFKGGFSDYHTGRSFDMAVFPKDNSSSGYYSPVGVYSWIDEHAADFGFILRYPENKDAQTGERARSYTYRYVGAPHAQYITQNSLCLEEYITLLKEHNKDKPLEISTASGAYCVYYVPANNNASTDVPVPANKVYTVSGNNIDGFIVTVSMN